MSSNNVTHHTYNTYTFKPFDGPPPPGVDHNMDDVLDKQKTKQRKRSGPRRVEHNFKKIKMQLKGSVSHTEAEAAADASADRHHIPPDDVSY